MEYWVYENWTVKKARIHEGPCPYCNHGQGTDKPKPAEPPMGSGTALMLPWIAPQSWPTVPVNLSAGAGAASHEVT